MRSLVGGAAIGVLLHAAPVLAAPLTAKVNVERAAGAEDCPDAAALQSLIARILNAPGAAGPSDAGVGVLASVAFSRTTAGYQATLSLGGAKDGRRTLTDTAPTCTALGRAVSITMALVLDEGEERAPPLAAPGAAVAPSAPEPPPATRAMTTSGVLSVMGGPAFGVVGPPSWTSGVELEAGVGRRLRLELSGQYVAPRSTAFDTGAVDVGLRAARLGLCGVLNDPDATIHVSLCAQGAGGRLRGSGGGFPAANESHDLTFWVVGWGLHVEGTLARRLVVGVQADVLVPLRTYTFSVGNRGVAYESDAVAGMLQLAVGVKIW